MSGRRFATACVVTPHHLASETGRRILAEGGNAMDAAIGANLTLGVVAPYLCGYGGDLFALVWRDGVQGYNGSGRAPAGATLDAVRAATGGAGLPWRGPLTVTVPGVVEAWFELLAHYGSRPFADLSRDALSYARDGFDPGPRGAAAIASAGRLFATEQGWSAVYGGARAGAMLRQPGLARTIDTLADQGPEPYYRGEIAREIAEAVSERGGFMLPADLGVHTGEWVEPMSLRYRDVTVLEMPPNTQGVAVLEALAILDGMPRAESGLREHRMLEAVKLALSDLDARVADPRTMTTMTEEVLEPTFVENRRASIEDSAAGDPVRWRARGGDTAYLCAADRDGMVVSLIQSNYAGFGSGITVEPWGINLHNRGAWFTVDPTHPNVIGPGKRTMHTLIPAMAMRDDRPWLCFGTMGGEGQAQTHVQLLTRMIDDALDPQDAIDAPRWYVSPWDWSVAIEDRVAPELVEELRARGHRVSLAAPYDQRMGHAHAIRLDGDGYSAGCDPRSEGAALGL